MVAHSWHNSRDYTPPPPHLSLLAIFRHLLVFSTIFRPPTSLTRLWRRHL